MPRPAPRPRKFNGIETSESHPCAVALLTPMRNTLAFSLDVVDFQRVLDLLTEIVEEDGAHA